MSFLAVKPKQLSQEALEKLQNQSSQQEAGGGTSPRKSFDPDNYPVFDYEADDKFLIYVPNHRVIDKNGNEVLRMERYGAHPVKVGRIFDNIRCTHDIVSEELGLDGTCPLCEKLNKTWELFKLQRSDIAKSKGIIEEAMDPAQFKEAMKDDSKTLLQNRAIREREMWVTFPIVVIECETNADGKRTTKPKLVNGQLVGKTYWYQVREKTYEEKWGKGLSSAIDADGNELTTPAGSWFVLDFSVAANTDEKLKKMTAARNMSVVYRAMQADTYKQWEKVFDKETESWTPAKCTETVVQAVYRTMDEMQAAANEIIAETEAEIQKFQIASGATPSLIGQNSTPAIDADAALKEFGGGVDVDT